MDIADLEIELGSFDPSSEVIVSYSVDGGHTFRHAPIQFTSADPKKTDKFEIGILLELIPQEV